MFLTFFFSFLYHGMRYRKKERELNNEIQEKETQVLKLLFDAAAENPLWDKKFLAGIITKTFNYLVQAYNEVKPAPLKDNVTADFFEKLDKKLKRHSERGEATVIENYSLNEIHFIVMRRLEGFDSGSFTAFLCINKADYVMNNKHKSVIDGTPFAKKFWEFWTFELENEVWLLKSIENYEWLNPGEKNKYFEEQSTV